MQRSINPLKTLEVCISPVPIFRTCDGCLWSVVSASLNSMSEEATKRYYDEFSHWYERERGRGYHALIDDLEVRVTEEFARRGDVLEVGCGTGLILERVARIARKAVGIDLSPGMLKVARERGLDVKEGIATALPFEDASFDVTYSYKVLAHVPEIETALSEMARVTRPGGTVLAEFYNPWSVRYLAKRLGPAGRISENTTEAAVYTRFDSPNRIREILPPSLELIGFRGVRVITPTAKLISLPFVGSVISRIEHSLLDSPAAMFGGFLIAVLKKRA
jgi:ubiquinone/menaquinone biosynthesis C-methylase UbiE